MNKTDFYLLWYFGAGACIDLLILWQIGRQMMCAVSSGAVSVSDLVSNSGARLCPGPGLDQQPLTSCLASAHTSQSQAKLRTDSFKIRAEIVFLSGFFE